MVGESGSGKSVTALSILKLIPQPPGRIVEGRILFKGRDLVPLTNEQMRAIRGKEISMIFQEPMTALNPVYTCGEQIIEALVLHEKMTRAQARTRAIEMLERVGIPAAGAARRRVSAPAVGRHAAARDDRHGAGVPAGRADRRRADDGARRDDSGADPRAAQGAAARDGHGGHPHHARSRRGGGDGAIASR